MKILVTGASGNLGSRVTRHLLTAGHDLRLLRHKSPVPIDISSQANVSVFHGDLGHADSLGEACAGTDCIVT